MHNIIITLLAYLIDKKFGEFSFIKHPVIVMGKMIVFFEKRFYKDYILRGFWLVVFMVCLFGVVGLSVEYFLDTLPTLLDMVLSSFIASMFIAHKMLKDSVREIVFSKNKKEKLSRLVSRDVDNMDESEIYKSAIETYAENLSDGVVAPMFYLLFFGLTGIIIYKTINTMDSMVGYRDKRYEKFGKVAARLDDIANYIPARLTAVLIMVCAKQKDIFSFYQDGKKHDSPNAGHPITAMALACGIRLGGDTYYFKKLKKKAYFGKGEKEIVADNVLDALKIC